MVFEVSVQEVGIHSVNHVTGDEERVSIGAAKGAFDLATLGKLFHDALHDARQEVAMCTLSE